MHADTVCEQGSAHSAFARDVLAGLSNAQKSVPCTWLYD